MRLEVFEAFLEVAQCHSMTVASEHLYTSQQNMSKMIRELEDDLDTKLFLRAKGHLTLTEDGRTAAGAIGEIMRIYHQMQEDIQGAHPDQGEQDRVINVLISRGASESFRSIFYNMSCASSNLMLEVRELDLDTLINANDSYEADYLLFRFVDQPNTQKYLKGIINRYEIFRLEHGRLRVFMNRASSYAKNTSLSLQQIESIPLIGSPVHIDSTKTNYDIVFEHLSVNPNRVFVNNRISDWEYYLRSNSAFVVATENAMSDIKEKMGNQLVSVPLREKLYSGLFLCRRKGAGLGEDNCFERAVLTRYSKTIEPL